METKLYLNFGKTTEQICFLKIRTNSELGIRNLILIPKCLNKRRGWPKA